MELIWDVTGVGEFSNADRLQTLGEERRDGQKDQEVVNKKQLKGLVRYPKGTDRRIILQSERTGTWMSVHRTTVSGTVLSATEFRDFFCAGYNLSPLNLWSHCDSCGTAFELTHALRCSIGGLVVAHHN